MKKNIYLFILASLVSCSGNQEFQGKWNWTKNSDKAIFTIDIEKNNGAYFGKYCAVMYTGKKLDCGDEKFKIEMDKYGNGKMMFKSAFSGQRGEATLTQDTSKLLWEVVVTPAGEFFVPLKAEFKKE